MNGKDFQFRTIRGFLFSNLVVVCLFPCTLIGQLSNTVFYRNADTSRNYLFHYKLNYGYSVGYIPFFAYKVNTVSETLPASVEDYNLQRSNALFPIGLRLEVYGYLPKSYDRLIGIFDHRRLTVEERINLADDAMESIVRTLEHRISSVAFSYGAQLGKCFNAQLGFGFRRLKEKNYGLEQFNFSNTIAISSIFPNYDFIPDSKLGPSFFKESASINNNYYNMYFLWGISYRIDVKDKFYIKMGTINPFTGDLGFALSAKENKGTFNQRWEEDYILEPRNRFPVISDFFYINLGLMFSGKKRATDFIK